MIERRRCLLLPGTNLEEFRVEIPTDWEHYEVYAEGKYIRFKRIVPKEVPPLPGQMKLFTEEE